MEEAVTVSEPCSAVDIVPTLSNLFGLEYDSRLLSGRTCWIRTTTPPMPTAVSRW